MGGIKEFKLNDDLRVHENNNEVHVHNDSTKEKLSMKASTFRARYFSAKKDIINGNETEVAIEDDKGAVLTVKKTAQDDIEWSLAQDKQKGKIADGFDDLDNFLA